MMSPERALRWKTRFAVLYALGSWTILGSIVYFHYWGKRQLLPGEERTPPTEKPADPLFNVNNNV